MDNNTIKLVKTIVSISCITAIEITALCLGYDGAILAGVIAAIAGIGGYTIGKTT